MKLYGTPRSHFTRKVRLLLDHLHQPYELIDVGNVAESERSQFAGHPLMSVPVLMHDDVTVYDSDLIATYVVRQFDPDDQFDVLTTEPETLNARVLLNGAMAAQVRLVLAERCGLNIENAYFDKARLVIRNVLEWFEARPALLAAAAPNYLCFHFVSFWDHLCLYGLKEGSFPTLEAVALRSNQWELVARSAPS